MKIKNISDGKIIGIGEATILPGESKDVPKEYENNPTLELYKSLGFAKISGSSSNSKKNDEADKEATTKKSAKEAEALRKARLASLDGITPEALSSLAEELGIKHADCKDQADVLAKVTAALKK